jgi:hypothetical protein
MPDFQAKNICLEKYFTHVPYSKIYKTAGKNVVVAKNIFLLHNPILRIFAANTNRHWQSLNTLK